jgi:hypothetical protein
MRNHSQRLFCAGLLLATLCCGCQHVSPWQRGALAEPVMRADRDALGTMMAEHMWFSREAATGGRGVGGGGCGCN